ncbi:MAG: hypothetical protein AAF226_06345 [Verrucomicrobiota bacterium]
MKLKQAFLFLPALVASVAWILSLIPDWANKLWFSVGTFSLHLVEGTLHLTFNDRSATTGYVITSAGISIVDSPLLSIFGGLIPMWSKHSGVLFVFIPLYLVVFFLLIPALAIAFFVRKGE